MIILSLSGSEYQLLISKKGLFSADKIIACSRKTFPQQIFREGNLVDFDSVVTILQEAILTTCPKSFTEKELFLVVPDVNSFLYRLTIPKVDDLENMNQLILAEVSKRTNKNPKDLENFYKTIKEDNAISQVLYTAMNKEFLLQIKNLTARLNLHLSLLSTHAFSVFKLIQPLITEKRVVYVDYQKNQGNFYFYDQYGPIDIITKNIPANQFSTATKGVIEHWQTAQNLKLEGIIVGGEQSLEISDKTLSSNLPELVKIADIIDNLLTFHKITIDTGGTARLFFVNSLGVFINDKRAFVPNYAQDIQLIHQDDQSKDNNIPKKEKEIKVMTQEGEKKEIVAEQVSSFITENIVEHKKRNFFEVIMSKKTLFILAFLLGLIMVISGIYSQKTKLNFKLPFSTTTPTLTVTPIPTSTIIPTPTIDTTLKRTDLTLLSVQNGTDKAGYAKEIATFLEIKGYKNIDKANADRDDYQKTEVRIKEEKKKYLPLLLADLQSKFSTPQIASLAAESKFDLVVILGKE